MLCLYFVMFEYFRNNKVVSYLDDHRFIFVGIIFIIIQFMSLYKYMFLSDFSNILWFCSHATLIFGIAFLYKRINIIKAMISVGLLIQFFWIVDFLGKLFFDVYIFSATEYMFVYSSFFGFITSIFEHLTGILALVLTFNYKPEKTSLIYSFVYLLVLLVVSFLFGTAAQNYNFVHFLPIFNDVTFAGYQYVWIFLAMLIVVIPTYFIQVWLYKYHKSRH